MKILAIVFLIVLVLLFFFLLFMAFLVWLAFRSEGENRESLAGDFLQEEYPDDESDDGEIL